MKLSFIIPVYNGKDTIVRCLDSIARLFAEENEIEAIVVDDCSTDGTLSILEKYSSLHHFVHYVHLPVNKKPGGARNVGLSLASGEFVMFLDSDDTAEPGVVNALSYALNTTVDVLLCQRTNQEVEDGTFTDIHMEVPIHQTLEGGDFLDNFYSVDSMGSCSSYLFRKSYLDRIAHSFAEGLFFEDTDWVEYMLYHCSRIEYDNSILFAYYSTPSSVLHSMDITKEADIVLNYCRRMEFAFSVKEGTPLFYRQSVVYKDWIASIISFRHLTRFSREDVSLFYHRLKAHHGFSWLEKMEKQGFTRLFVSRPKIALLLLSLSRPFLECGRRIVHSVRRY